MNRMFRLGTIALIIFSCTASILLQNARSLAMPTRANFTQNISQNIDLGRHFRELEVEGSILIYDAKSDRTFQHNSQRNQTAFLPASTFKILNSLIALETGVIADEKAVFTWDGISRMIPEWNRDLTVKEAFKISAVWFYQVIARRVGYDRMKQLVTQSGYGNQNIGDADEIDRFWLEGELRITPQQQIQFLRRLYNNNLPFSERSLSIVKDIMIVEKTPEYTIRGKTGWVGVADDVTPKIGWYVGYLEKGKDVYFFATNIDIRNPKDPSYRKELTHRCFQDIGVQY
ncbi:MAG: class D beta-lactamase [Oscillatoriales cyanobacterium RU_3_3]|nr:class D beta-lactamase [Oscillatoriales cyanobacterium RU_3_3]NJR22797.1 class D beta-lactamase [Richelia sp. CSU_2_1]